MPHSQPTEASAPPPTVPARLITTALPVPRTTLVGCAAELAQIQTQLGEPACRLLTLAGPGGVGKTRLVLPVAHELHDATYFSDGVVWVSLAPAVSEQDAHAALAAALGLTLSPGADVATQLAEALTPAPCCWFSTTWSICSHLWHSSTCSWSGRLVCG